MGDDRRIGDVFVWVPFELLMEYIWGELLDAFENTASISLGLMMGI